MTAEQVTIFAELERIRKRCGALTARAVWEHSASPKARLHDRFTWDDTEAGKLWRDQEARIVIQSVIVANGDHADVRRYVHVIVGDSPRYEPIEIVVANRDMYLFALQECEAALVAAKKRISDLTSTATVVGKIDGAIRSVRKMQREHRAEV